MFLPAISQHLQVLCEAGLITQQHRGRQRIYRLNPCQMTVILVGRQQQMLLEKRSLGDTCKRQRLKALPYWLLSCDRG